MRYPDTVKLVAVTSDGYGDRTPSSIDEVPASFIRRAGIERGVNNEGESSDAAVYLLHTHPVVLANLDTLEGMYIHAEPFSDDSWYRVITATVAERKLLNNVIDNVYCRLEKVAGLAYGISIS